MAKDNYLETLLNKSQGATLWLERLKDPYDFGGKVRFRNPCDYIGAIEGKPLMLEAKETVGDEIQISTYITSAKKKHQLDSMTSWARFHPHHVSGYVCYLGAVTTVLWVPVLSIPLFKKISLDVVGTLGVRAIDLSTQRVDWPYLILGRDINGGSKP